MKNPFRSITRTMLRHLCLLAGALLILAPFIWALLISCRPPEELFSAEFQLLPKKWALWRNYAMAFTESPLLRYVLNGIIVCSAIFLLQVLVALPCAYALAKLRFRGRSTLFAMVLIALLVPPQVLAIPRYVLCYQAGILNSYAALIVPFTISVFGIFLMRQFFRSVPDDLVHAARLDGLSEFAIVWRIMLPAAYPAVVAFGIFSLVSHWNDLFWPMIVIHSEHLATPPLGAVLFINEEAGNDYGALMAAMVIITAPLVAVFLMAQRRFVEGITLTGMR